MYVDYTEAERAWLEHHVGHPLDVLRTHHVGGRLISVRLQMNHPSLGHACTHYLEDLCCAPSLHMGSRSIARRCVTVQAPLWA